MEKNSEKARVKRRFRSRKVWRFVSNVALTSCVMLTMTREAYGSSLEIAELLATHGSSPRFMQSALSFAGLTLAAVALIVRDLHEITAKATAFVRLVVRFFRRRTR